MEVLTGDIITGETAVAVRDEPATALSERERAREAAIASFNNLHAAFAEARDNKERVNLLEDIEILQRLSASREFKELESECSILLTEIRTAIADSRVVRPGFRTDLHGKNEEQSKDDKSRTWHHRNNELVGDKEVVQEAISYARETKSVVDIPAAKERKRLKELRGRVEAGDFDHVGAEDFDRLTEELDGPVTELHLESLASERRRKLDEQAFHEREAKKSQDTSERGKKLKQDSKAFQESKVEENLQEVAESGQNLLWLPCSVKEAIQHVPAGSVDLIVTDPPYAEEWLHCFDELGEFALHALRPGGYCVVMPGGKHLDQKLARLSKYLNHRHEGGWFMEGSQISDRHANIQVEIKSLQFYQSPDPEHKGSYTPSYKSNYIDATVSQAEVDEAQQWHEWGQPARPWTELMRRWSVPGMVICDPFLGGGTSAISAAECEAAKFIGIDIDPENITKSEARFVAYQAGKVKNE